jgi:hypothetical protein
LGNILLSFDWRIVGRNVFYWRKARHTRGKSTSPLPIDLPSYYMYTMCALHGASRAKTSSCATCMRVPHVCLIWQLTPPRPSEAAAGPPKYGTCEAADAHHLNSFQPNKDSRLRHDQSFNILQSHHQRRSCAKLGSFPTNVESAFSCAFFKSPSPVTRLKLNGCTLR